MAEITAQMVKELRERTQAGMTDCKSALVEAEGDMEKAVEVILKKGLAKSAKRAGAWPREGEVRRVGVTRRQERRASSRSTSRPTSRRATTSSKRSSPRSPSSLRPPSRGKSSTRSPTLLGQDARRGSRRAQRANRRKHRRASFRAARASRSRRSGALLRALGRQDRRPSRSQRGKRGGGEASGVQEVRRRCRDADRGDEPALPHAQRGASERESTSRKRSSPASYVKKPSPSPKRRGPRSSRASSAKWFTEVCLVEQESVIVPGSTIDKCARRCRRPRKESRARALRAFRARRGHREEGRRLRGRSRQDGGRLIDGDGRRRGEHRKTLRRLRRPRRDPLLLSKFTG